MKSTRRFLIIVAVLLGVAVASVGIAYAVTNGQPDGNAHPYVGLVHNDVYACSGSAISDTVFVTAAHCFFYSGEQVWVTFDPEGPYSWHTGRWYPHLDFCIGCGPGLKGFDTHDVAVVVFDAPVTLPRYAQLPTEGLVDTLPMMEDVTLVGYGVRWQERGGGPPEWEGFGTRYFAPTKLVASKHVHDHEYIKLTANPAQEKGGTCFGDSGGPDLLGGTDIILAINSYVTSYQCAGVTYSNRIDTEYALEFINSFPAP